MTISSVGKGLRIWANIGRSVIVLTSGSAISLYPSKAFEIAFAVT